VLSTPKLRAEYDRELRLRGVGFASSPGSGKVERFKTGVEVVDLDDLAFDDREDVWYRGCRCGDERGFLLREGDLEGAVQEGEITVGCRGCSLWVKVLFGVIEEG